jgi:peptidoglycan hydrolase-like protein with peptidoglycan-binding domain
MMVRFHAVAAALTLAALSAGTVTAATASAADGTTAVPAVSTLTQIRTVHHFGAAVTARTAVAAAQPVLRLGSRGGAVKTVQQRLGALHYFDVGPADGVFGANTYHAVIAFQKVQGLTRDGIVGPVTWARLARPYVPAPRYRLATASVEVNLARQVIYYVRSGKIQRIIDSSTGSGAWYYSQGRWARAITPTGRFGIYWRYNGWQPGPLGSMYRPNYFHGGYALHGMTSVPAYPASHGCVRMTVPTMDRMWSSLWIGMPVAIYRSLPASASASGSGICRPLMVAGRILQSASSRRPVLALARVSAASMTSPSAAPPATSSGRWAPT